jgi:hypothetical protein
VVAAFLEHRGLAEAENNPERFFISVQLVHRVLPPQRPPRNRAARA